MKKRIMTRRRMNHVASELSNALLLMGGRQIDLHLLREDNGLRLRIEGDFAPEHQREMERMARLLQPKVRDPALVETYWELAGGDQYTSESEMALVGQMLDAALVEVSEGRVQMNLYLAFETKAR